MLTMLLICKLAKNRRILMVLLTSFLTLSCGVENLLPSEGTLEAIDPFERSSEPTSEDAEARPIAPGQSDNTYEKQITEEEKELAKSLQEWAARGLGIIGGESADFETIRSTVALISKDGSCSATLISESMALTAAHCFKENRINHILTFGNVANSGTVRRVTKMNTPERRDWFGIRLNDIALIEFEGGIPEGYTSVPIIDKEEIYPGGAPFIIAGFGFSDPDNPRSYGTLNQADNHLSKSLENIGMIETAGINGDACYGDSGGSVYFEKDGLRYLSGIISQSAGGGCGANLLSVDLRQYIDWILEQGYEAPSEETEMEPSPEVIPLPPKPEETEQEPQNISENHQRDSNQEQDEDENENANDENENENNEDDEDDENGDEDENRDAKDDRLKERESETKNRRAKRQEKRQKIKERIALARKCIKENDSFIREKAQEIKDNGRMADLKAWRDLAKEYLARIKSCKSS